MSEFLSHGGCPKCSSSDAFASYRGGSGYCFSCGWYVPPTGSPYRSMEVLEEVKETKSLPLDAGMEYSQEVVYWTNKYFVPVETLVENNILYSKSRNQLIFTFYADSDNSERASPQGGDGFDSPVLWQARNFYSGAKQKYYTQGEKERVVPYYGSLENDKSPIIVVEDCISAIRCASLGTVSVPCLGSTMGRDKLARLRAVLGPSRTIVVWLDSNMYDKAQQISQRLALLGSHTRVVWSEEDPKVYTNDEIKERLLIW